MLSWSEQARKMYEQACAQIEQVDDPEELEKGIKQMEAMLPQAPAEYLPAIRMVIEFTKGRQRLIESQ